MKQNLLTLAILTIALTLTPTSTNSLSAQVTIGSATPPRAGALLDLTQGAITTGGLNLPRVTLSNLKPATPAELSASIGNTGNWDLDEHIGLLVYNAKANGSICPGIYIWDGTNWVAIGGEKKTKPDITMTDIDGNTYNAKWFTADPCDPAAGAYWTTENLYTTKDKTGGAFISVDFADGARLNPGKYNTGNGAIVITSISDFTGTVTWGQDAASISATNQTLPMKDYAAKFGLSYTHAQAMLACPANWHLPTDADWDALAIAHGGATVAAAAMRADNDYYLGNDNATSYKWGSTDAAGTTLSGFNALPSGRVLVDASTAANFSTDINLWSATGGSYRSLNNNTSSLSAYTGSTGYYYFPVRCVKD